MSNEGLTGRLGRATRPPSPGGTDVPAAGSRSFGRWWGKQSKLGMGFSLCLVIYYGFIFVIPFGVGIWLSFHNWDFIGAPVFVGFENYVTALTDPYFWQSLLNTALFCVTEIVVGISLAVGIAYLLSRIPGTSQRVLLAIYYLPVVMPTVVTVFLFQLMYTPQGGLFNDILGFFHLPPQQFTNSPNQALWSTIVMILWAELGGGIVLFLATVKNLPKSMLEAAELDGAGPLRSFIYVLVPLIRPVLVYQLVVSVIGTVQLFTQFQLVNGPDFSTRTLSVYAYVLGFQSNDLGYSAAISVIMFVLLLGATATQLRTFRIQWEY